MTITQFFCESTDYKLSVFPMGNHLDISIYKENDIDKIRTIYLTTQDAERLIVELKRVIKIAEEYKNNEINK